jgi:hypothetical protein
VKATAPVRTYLAMRERVYDHIEKRYMPLSEWDGYPAYQSLLPLPTVDQLLGREPMDAIAAAARQKRGDRSSRQPASRSGAGGADGGDGSRAGGVGGGGDDGRDAGGKPGKPQKPFRPLYSEADAGDDRLKAQLLKWKEMHGHE